MSQLENILHFIRYTDILKTDYKGVLETKMTDITILIWWVKSLLPCSRMCEQGYVIGAVVHICIYVGICM